MQAAEEHGGTAGTNEVEAALDAWAARVRANREQVDRIREVPDGPDFYAPVTAIFRDDPGRTDDPQLDALLALARPDETWLDIGAGAGRFALPLARRVRRVIALDPSDSMRAALRDAMTEHGIPNIEIRSVRWPPSPADADGPPLEADVALIANVGYDIEEIGPFLDAMEAAAARLCVALLMDRQPSSSADPFWPPIHGETRVSLPGFAELVELLRLRGRSPDLELVTRRRRAFESLEQLERFARRQLWIEPGGAKDELFRSLVPGIAVHDAGGFFLERADPRVGIVTWVPGPLPRAGTGGLASREVGPAGA